MKFTIATALAFLMLAGNASAQTYNNTTQVDNNTARAGTSAGQAYNNTSQANNTSICADEFNPLNLRKYNLNGERITRGGWSGGDFKKPVDMHHMVFKWIPRDSVACAGNELTVDEQVKRFQFVENAALCKIDASLKCQGFISSWLKKMRDAILHDLLVVIKDKSNELFNKYYDLKLSRFGSETLISDMGEEILGELQQLQRDLKDGFTLPNKAAQPSLEEFDESLGNPITIYRDILMITAVNRKYTEECRYAAIIGREKSRDECVRSVMAYVTGKKTSLKDQHAPVGYADITKLFDKAIKLIREHFKVDQLEYDPRLPHVVPCFADSVTV